jgi:putative MATE family efflux protein
MRRDLTSGSITRNILHLAWPTALAMFLQTSFNIIDTIFVGRISSDAIAAVSMVFPVFFLIFALASGIGVGTTSLIARYLGCKRKQQAINAAEHSFLLAALMSLFFTVIGLIFQKPIFTLMGAGPEILPLVLGYSTWIFGGSIFIFFFVASSSVLRGEGDMKTPMRMMITSIVINTILDPLLIFGIGIFPRLGVAGAALATIVSRAIGCVLIVRYLFNGNAMIKLRLRYFKYDLMIIKKILSVGFPTSINQLIMSLGFIFLIKIVSAFGATAIASFGIVVRLNQIVILPSLGIAAAVITIVGRNVGARKFQRAESTAWKATIFAMIAMEIVGVIYFMMPELWISIFTRNFQVIDIGVSYLRIISLSYMFTGLSIITGAAFQGAGKGLPALTITTLRLVILAVPGAYLLSKIYGLIGVWIAIASSSVIASIISALWFKAGTWKKTATSS